MKRWKQYFLTVAVLLLGVEYSTAQPRGCSATFSPLRTCNSHYLTQKFVFLGRVVSRDEKLTQIDGEQLWKVRVAVDESIKGNLARRTMDLFLSQICRGTVEEGEKYIFTADRVKKAGFDELVSSRWSSTLKNISDAELKKLLTEIRSVAKGTKQPSLVGKVVQYDSNPLGNYDFQGKSLDTKEGYNPQYSRPMAGVEIIAKPVDGNLNPVGKDSYKTKTNPDGSYEFKDLPAGFYELSLTLPEELYVRAYLYKPSEILDENPFQPILEKRIYVEIRKGICSEDIRFNVRQVNGGN